MKIADYLDRKLVLFLDISSRDEAIDSLIDRLDSTGRLADPAAFRKAIFHREQLVSTGIGLGVAIPHAKMKDFSDFFIVVGIQKKKGLEWNALDKVPVRLIFLIGGPEGRQTEYLQILSLLTAAIRDVDLRKELLKASSEEEAIALFSEFSRAE
ncbi:MAG: PTS sugar transporter subunit IIA [Verrucomicrobia bacterium]|nr:PTS sugar transporter subunit IIA [Verrucomicrobiota bacterium]